VEGVGPTAFMMVITDGDALYSVTDDHARTEDDTMDLAGPSGDQALAGSLNRDFVVAVSSRATETTLVRINPADHRHDRATPGPLNAAIARAVVHIHRQQLGRGPTKAQSFFRGNLVVVFLEDVMTRAERSLAARGDIDTVLAIRSQYQETMREDLESSIEKLTGRRVKASMSAHHVDPDMAAEIFVLDRPVRQPPPLADATD
jgi:uncharacterized protein YbcI